MKTTFNNEDQDKFTSRIFLVVLRSDRAQERSSIFSLFSCVKAETVVFLWVFFLGGGGGGGGFCRARPNTPYSKIFFFSVTCGLSVKSAVKYGSERTRKRRRVVGGDKKDWGAGTRKKNKN